MRDDVPVDRELLTTWNPTTALAAVFGLVSIPWTYGFVAVLGLPLWPSFVAAASFFAAGGGRDGLRRSATGNVAGIAYAAATVGVVDGVLGGGTVALAVVVGAAMCLASLHGAVEPLSYLPATFLGYAALFGVHGGGWTAFGVPGLAGAALAALAAMLLGALIGYGAERASERLA